MFINGLPDYDREGKQRKTGLICGRCAKDAQIYTTNSGTVIGSVSVPAYNKQDGTTAWMTVKGFGSMGRIVANALKGDPIIAVGRLEPREYEGKTYMNLIAEWAAVGAGAIPNTPQNLNSSNEPGSFQEIEDDGELPF